LIDLIKTKYPKIVPGDFPRAFPMFATYGRDGDEGAQQFADAIEEIGRRMEAKAANGDANGHVNGHGKAELLDV